MMAVTGNAAAALPRRPSRRPHYAPCPTSSRRRRSLSSPPPSPPPPTRGPFHASIGRHQTPPPLRVEALDAPRLVAGRVKDLFGGGRQPPAARAGANGATQSPPLRPPPSPSRYRLCLRCLCGSAVTTIAAAAVPTAAAAVFFFGGGGVRGGLEHCCREGCACYPHVMALCHSAPANNSERGGWRRRSRRSSLPPQRTSVPVPTSRPATVSLSPSRPPKLPHPCPVDLGPPL